MFLALDECIGNDYVTLGCICISTEKLPQIEKSFIQKRIEHKCWGEVKWSKITDGYRVKYQELANCYLADEDVTFHSWTYKKPNAIERSIYYGLGTSQNDVIFRHAYLLIRSVIRKCKNSGYNGSFYVVADDSGSGPNEYKKTNELLQADSAISGPTTLDFCSTGNSTVIGALQVVDLCTGAVTSYYDDGLKNNSNQKFVKHLVELNGSIPLNFSPSRLPKLKEYKMHHCLVKN